MDDIRLPSPEDDLDPRIAAAIRDAYSVEVDVETAARHLWVLHREAESPQRFGQQSPQRFGQQSPQRFGQQSAPHAGATVPSDAPVRPESPAPAPARPGVKARVRRRGVRRTTVTLLAGLMLFGSSGAALAASQSSLPGDVLYPVKRGFERAQLMFTRSATASAALQLRFAQTRLDELVAIGDTRPEHVPPLVADLEASLVLAEQRGGDEVDEQTRTLRATVTQEIAALDLPEDVAAALPLPTVTPVTAPTADPLDAVATPEPSPSAPTTTAQPTTSPSPTPTTTTTASPSPSPTTTTEPTTEPSSPPVVSVPPATGTAGSPVGGGGPSEGGGEPASGSGSEDSNVLDDVSSSPSESSEPEPEPEPSRPWQPDDGWEPSRPDDESSSTSAREPSGSEPASS